jgi:hypothetical protein
MIWPSFADASVANRGGGYAVESGEMRISDACRPDKMDFGGVEPSSGSIRGRDRYRKYVSWLVAGGRYELYSNYPLKIQAVAASIVARQ